MRTIYRSTSFALALAMGAGYSYADDKARDPHNPTKTEVQTRDKTAAQGEKGAKGDKEKLTRVHRVSDLMGATITNAQNESLGTVDDIVMNQKGDIKFAIIGHGGVLGIGESYIAAPWKAMKPAFGEDSTFTMNISKQELEKAPTFQRDNYQELQNREWLDRVHAHFKMEHDAKDADKAAHAKRDDAKATAADSHRLIRASQVIGASVVNAQRESIADVNDLVLDSKNCVSFAILGEGGFLSLGENLVAVPLQALNIVEMEDELAVTLDMPTDRLKQAPTLQDSNLAELNDPQFVDSTRRFYNVSDREEVQTEAPVDQQRRENKRELENRENQ